MFGVGMPEILLILAIALVVIGPKKLPDLAKTLGRAMGEFKKATQDFKRSLDMEDTIREFNEPLDPLANDLNNDVEDADGKEKDKHNKSNETKDISDEPESSEKLSPHDDPEPPHDTSNTESQKHVHGNTGDEDADDSPKKSSENTQQKNSNDDEKNQTRENAQKKG